MSDSEIVAPKIIIPEGLPIDDKRKDKLFMAINVARTVSECAHKSGNSAHIYVTFCTQGRDVVVYRVNGGYTQETIEPLREPEVSIALGVGTVSVPQAKRIAFNSNYNGWGGIANNRFKMAWDSQRSQYRTDVNKTYAPKQA